MDNEGTCIVVLVMSFKVSDSEDIEPTTKPTLSQNSTEYPVFYPVRNLGFLHTGFGIKKTAISVGNKHYLELCHIHTFHLSR